MAPSTRFIYHAGAVGLAAHFTRPFHEILESQAVSALPPSGGYSSARRENIRVREFLTCDVVTTQAAGSYAEKHDSFDTFASATVQGLSIGGIVKAVHISAHISSSHSASRDLDPSITPLGSAITGLSVAGHDIELESLVPFYTRHNDMPSLRKAYESEPEFRNMLDATMMTGQKSSLPDVRLHRFFPWCDRTPSTQLPEYRNTAILPLFRIKNLSSPGLTVHGNVLHVENFGRIQVGEIIISPYERRITGLRIDLGCPLDGTVECGAVNGNGSTSTQPPSN